MRYCFLNGAILPEDEAKVGILDIGLLRGVGIYEAMALVNGKIFRFEDHVARFRKTADFLHVTVPLDDPAIKKVIFDLVQKNAKGNIESGTPAPRMNIKFILTGGTAEGGIGYGANPPTFYVFLEAWKALDEKYYTYGVRIILHEHLRQYCEYKTTNYITAARLQKDMREAGALEILYTWQGTVLECATSNLFIVKDGALVTAKDNILAGVTRNVVIELAQKNGIKVEERAYSLNELFSADECFLTSSFKDVVPVVAVGDHMLDDHMISEGDVGETTKKITRLFGEYLQL
jgi:branched-subunit amino acid aminotransferase/4-amino-4-deoxychorismate lyase